jgi:MarR family transcriptional regulator, transcriptional regulator for hemolysin
MTLIEQLAQVHRSAERLVRRRVAARTDRPFLQLRALRAMRGDQIRTQAALAERLRIDAPAASRLIDRLVDDGLVCRKQGDDRRCICLSLTAAAAAELAILDEAVAHAEREVLRHVTRDQARALAPLLRKIAGGLAESDSAEE